MPIQIASLFAKIGADTSGLNTALKQTGHQLDRAGQQMQRGFGGATGAIGLLKLAAGSFVAREAVKMIKELSLLGAEAERAENSFVAVAGGVENATSTLETLRVATRGAKSDVELMTGTTNILALEY